MGSATITFSGSELLQRDPQYVGRERAVQLIASASYAKGTPLGELVGNNEIVKLAISGVPTGGTLTMTFGGQTTADTAYNATADLVRVRLEALSSIGAGNVKCYGGPWPNVPIIVEFVGALGKTNVGAITTTDSLTGGTTPASAATVLLSGAGATQVNSANAFRQVDKSLNAAPTAAPTLGTGTSGGALGAGTMLVAYSFANATGETALSPLKSQAVDGTSTDDTVTITAVTPPSGCFVKWYASNLAQGQLRFVNANDGSGWTITHETIGTDLPPGEARKPCYAYQDGRQTFKRLLKYATSTDSNGLHTLGDLSSGNENQSTYKTAPAYETGLFIASDLVSFTADMLADVNGRIVAGTLASASTCLVCF